MLIRIIIIIWFSNNLNWEIKSEISSLKNSINKCYKIYVASINWCVWKLYAESGATLIHGNLSKKPNGGQRKNYQKDHKPITIMPI